MGESTLRKMCELYVAYYILHMDYYNNRRCHHGLAHQVPGVVYAAAAAQTKKECLEVRR